MASRIQRTWIWANSRRWWGTEKLDVLQSRRLQRVRCNLATEQPPPTMFLIAAWCTTTYSVATKCLYKLARSHQWTVNLNPSSTQPLFFITLTGLTHIDVPHRINGKIIKRAQNCVQRSFCRCVTALTLNPSSLSATTLLPPPNPQKECRLQVAGSFCFVLFTIIT